MWAIMTRLDYIRLVKQRYNYSSESFFVNGMRKNYQLSLETDSQSVERVLSTDLTQS